MPMTELNHDMSINNVNTTPPLKQEIVEHDVIEDGIDDLRLAICYLEGNNGVGVNLKEAIRLLKESAGHYNPQAYVFLGVLSQIGKGLPQDDVFAAECYHKASDLGSSDGQYHYGVCLQYGRGVDVNLKEAASLYYLAAQQGNADGQTALGNCYKYGLGIDSNSHLAAKYYKMAALQGVAEAQDKLGLAYCYGEGEDENVHTAMKWFEKAANQSYAEANYHLGVVFEKGFVSGKVDRRTALTYYERAAEDGHVESMYIVGIAFEEGDDGFHQDLSKAVSYYHQAVEKGQHPGAQYRLGKLYEEGRGVKKDSREAWRLLNMSASQGHQEAQAELKQMAKNHHGHKCIIC